MTHEQILNTFLIFMICLFVFAIIRELICWYFKINKRVELQEKILAELVKINNKPVYDLEFNKTFPDRPCGKGGIL
tara:strand:- start:4417 stop:4644 length:228 start_codon:yes stop_codon:yes gene_type:complete